MNQKIRYWILTTDLLWIAVAFVVAQISRGGLEVDDSGLWQFFLNPAVPVALSVWIVLYFRNKLEGFCGGWHFSRVIAQVILGVSCLISSLLILSFLFKSIFPQSVLLYFGCLLPMGFIAIRYFAWRLVTSWSHRRAKRRVVILGSGRIVRELALKISGHPEMSMEVAGILCPPDSEPSSLVSDVPEGRFSVQTLDILSLMEGRQVQELIVVEPLPPGPESEKLLANCRKAGMRVHLVPQHYELYLSKAKLTEIDDVPLLSLEEQTLSTIGLGLKRAVDCLGGMYLLVLAAPLLVLSAGLLRRKRGTGFRRELRCGKNGIPFWLYRLNVDRDAPDLDGFEKVLVKFSFTELPQVWNVLKGDMSLVGPRPESADRVKHYSMWQRQRLSVTPGLTGLAQVNGLREQHSSEEKARFDLQYIFHWSLFLDLSLLLETVWTLLLRTTAEEKIAAAPSPKSKVATKFVTEKV